MQKTINFNVPVIGLDGAPMQDQDGDAMLGKHFAPIIAGQSQGDALKLLGWAMAMYKGEELVLDQSDINVLKNIVNNDPILTVVVKAPLLQLLNG